MYNQEQWRSEILLASSSGHCEGQGLNVCKADWAICSTVIEHMPVFPQGHMYTLAHKSLLYESARSNKVIKSRQRVNGKDNLTLSLKVARISQQNSRLNFTTSQSD